MQILVTRVKYFSEKKGANFWIQKENWTNSRDLIWDEKINVHTSVSPCFAAEQDPCMSTITLFSHAGIVTNFNY